MTSVEISVYEVTKTDQIVKECTRVHSPACQVPVKLSWIGVVEDQSKNKKYNRVEFSAPEKRLVLNFAKRPEWVQNVLRAGSWKIS